MISLSLADIITGEAMINKQKPIPPAVSKFCRLCYMAIIPHHFRILVSLLYGSRTSQFRYFLNSAHGNF